MRFSGRVEKQGNHWLAEVPALDLMTQGTSKQDALEMLRDAIESLVNTRGFKAIICSEEDSYFEVSGNDFSKLKKLSLKR